MYQPGKRKSSARYPSEARAARLPGARPGDLGRAVARADEPDEDLDERRLPGPVRPEEADELPLPDLEVDAPERLDRPVALPQAVDGEGFGTCALQREPAAELRRGDEEPDVPAGNVELLVLGACEVRDGAAVRGGSERVVSRRRAP